jgi:hypothetical protein
MTLLEHLANQPEKESINTIPLRDAYLCLDCETISDNSVACPKCSSIAVYSVSRFIDREIEMKDVDKDCSHELHSSCEISTQTIS